MASHQKHAESETNSNSNPNRRIRRAGFTTAAAAAAALALVGCAPGGGPSDGGPTPHETATTAPAPEFEGALPENFIIPAGLDAEAVVDEVVEGALTDWNNAGANDSLRYRIRSSDESREVVNAEVAAENKIIVTDNLFIDGWESNPNLVALADGGEISNLETLGWYSSTAWSSEEPENIEGFRSWMEVTAVREVDDGDGDPSTRTILADYTNHTNSDQNVGPEPQRVGGTFEISLKSDGSQERLADFEIS